MKHLVIYSTPSGQRAWVEVTCAKPEKNLSSPITWNLPVTAKIIAVIHNVDFKNSFFLVAEETTNAETI